MADQKKPVRKTTARRAKSGARPGASANASNASDAASGPMMGEITRRIRAFNIQQLDFAQESTEAYFKAMREVLNAKSLTEASQKYNRYLRDAVSRQTAHGRELGRQITADARAVAQRVTEAARKAANARSSRA